MSGLVIAVTVLILFELVVWRFGVDSRDAKDWRKSCSPVRLPSRTGGREP